MKTTSKEQYDYLRDDMQNCARIRGDALDHVVRRLKSGGTVQQILSDLEMFYHPHPDVKSWHHNDEKLHGQVNGLLMTANKRLDAALELIRELNKVAADYALDAEYPDPSSKHQALLSRAAKFLEDE